MLHQTLSIGPFQIPALLLLLLASGTAAHITVLILQNREGMRKASDSFFTLLTVYLLTWRLSLLLTNLRTVRESPTALLYLPGGPWNHGMAVAAVLLALGIWILRKRPTPRERAALALLVGITLIPLFLTGLISPTPPDAPLADAEATALRKELIVINPEAEEEVLQLESPGITVINIWASWCPPCRAEIPELKRWWGENREKEIRFIALNATSTESSGRAPEAFIRDHMEGLPVYLDPSGSASEFFGIRALPTTLVFDSRGELVTHKTGAVDNSWLNQALSRAGAP